MRLVEIEFGTETGLRTVARFGASHAQVEVCSTVLAGLLCCAKGT